MDSPIHAAPAGDDKTLLVADGFKHADDPVPILFELCADDHGVFRLVAETTSGRDASTVP